MTPFLFFFACLFSGTLLPVPEDATLLAAGVSIVDLPSFLGMYLAGVLGLLGRDAGFYFGGKAAGEGLFRIAWVNRMFGAERIDQARQRVADWGSKAILGARMAFGMRAAAFLVAGAVGVPVKTFLVWDIAALLVWVPVALVLGALVREPVLAGMEWVQEHPLLLVSMGLIVAAAWLTSEMARRSEAQEELPEAA